MAVSLTISPAFFFQLLGLSQAMTGLIDISISEVARNTDIKRAVRICLFPGCWYLRNIDTSSKPWASYQTVQQMIDHYSAMVES
jgi:hypothetical protein